MSLDVPVPEAVAVPCEAGVEMLQVRVSAGLASVACRVSWNGIGVLFSDMLTLTAAPSVMTGASFRHRLLMHHGVKSTLVLTPSPVPGPAPLGPEALPHQLFTASTKGCAAFTTPP